MGYDPRLRSYMCKSCGLSLTSQELMEIRDKTQSKEDSSEERKKKRKEYLDWWFSRKG